MTSDARQSDAGATPLVRDMTSGSIPGHLIAFSLPMLAGSLLQVVYSVVNGVWVGHFLGTNALAAVTVSMPAVFVLIAVAGGLTLATNVLVAQYAGAHDWDGIKRAVQTSFLLIGGISLVFLALGLIFVEELLRLMHAPAEVFPMAASYLRVLLWTLPCSFGLFLIGSMLRGIGDAKTPVLFQAVSVVVTGVLDPILMFGLLGLPRLGLNGTAWATLIAQAAAVVALLIFVSRRRPLVRPDWRRPRIDAATAGLLLVIGVPSMVQQSVVSVSLLVIVSIVSAFGAQADAAYGAALRIDQVAFLPALTIGMAVSTLAGQNIGARRYARVRSVFWWGILLGGAICLLIAIAAFTIPRVLVHAFLNDPAAISIAAGYLRIVALAYVLYAVMFVSNGIINGSGHTLATTLISLAALWGVRLPLASILPRHLHTVEGVWYAMLISVACGMVLSLAYYFSGLWKLAPVVKLGRRNQQPAPAG